MPTALVLHGVCDRDEYFGREFPSPSNAHWLPWLQQKFLRAGVLCQTPEMPAPYAPIFRDWADTFERFRIAADTVVVAHSAGCGFILKWLNLHPEISIKKLVLVAPWLDLARTHGDFLDGALNPALQSRIGEIHVLYSKNETTAGVEKAKNLILETLPQSQLHLFDDKGHFCLSDLGSQAFEPLWNLCRDGGILPS